MAFANPAVGGGGAGFAPGEENEEDKLRARTKLPTPYPPPQFPGSSAPDPSGQTTGAPYPQPGVGGKLGEGSAYPQPTGNKTADPTPFQGPGPSPPPTPWDLTPPPPPAPPPVSSLIGGGLIGIQPPTPPPPLGGPVASPPLGGLIGIPTPTPAPPTPPPATPATPALGVYQGIDPSASLSAADARAHIEAILGRPLTPAELQQAISISGWNGTGNLTGAQFNRVIQEAARLTGQTFTAFAPPAPAVPPTPPPGGGPVPPWMEQLVRQSAQSPVQQQGQQALQSLLSRLSQPVSIQDSELQGASDAFRAQQQRGVERRRNALAERMAATGGAGSGGFDTGVLGIEADAANASAARDSELVLGEMRDRRQQLQSAIQLAESTGQFQQSQELQRQLALLDANIRQQGIDLQGRGLDLQRLLGMGDLDLRRLGITQQGQLGRGDLALRLAQLLMGNRQFYDQLGTQHSQWLANFNQGNLQQLLGGF